MDSPLQALFQAIAQAQTEAELKQSVMAKVGEYFAATRWKLWVLDPSPSLDKNTPVLAKRALSLDANPVLRYVVQHHTVVHDEIILPPGVWRTLCPRADHGHVMAGPVVSAGQLIGGVTVTRHRNDPKFNTENLTDLSALSLHLSTRLSTLRAQCAITVPSTSINANKQVIDHRLTSREMEIVALVAQGLTNKAIGETLWITENSVKQALKRIFRKIQVASRAEMVAKLSASIAIAANQSKPKILDQ